jgi:large subunit ribosomal protein L30
LSGRKLRITLTRSLIGLKPKHVRTLRALGLRRIRATVSHDDTPAVRGMLAQVPYAVRVEPEGSDVAETGGQQGAASRRPQAEGAATRRTVRRDQEERQA